MNMVISKPHRVIPIEARGFTPYPGRHPGPQHFETIPVRPRMVAQAVRYMLGLSPLPWGDLTIRRKR